MSAGPASRRLDGLILDVDGTLVDSLPLCIEAIRAAIAPYHPAELDDRSILARLGPSEEGIVRRAVPAGEGDRAYARFWAVYRAEHDRGVSIFPGIEAMLDALAAHGVRLAVVTGKGADTAEFTLGKLGLGRRFESVRAGSLEGGHKAENLQATLRGWGMPADRVAYLGDAPSDMQLAHAGGVRALGAAWAASSRAAALRSAGAETTFSSPAEVERWLVPGP